MRKNGHTMSTAYGSASQIGARGPRTARGRFKMARERLAVNCEQVHLAREAKIWPARGYFWPAREFFLARGQKYLRSTGLWSTLHAMSMYKKHVYTVRVFSELEIRP